LFSWAFARFVKKGWQILTVLFAILVSAARAFTASPYGFTSWPLCHGYSTSIRLFASSQPSSTEMKLTPGW